jgi:hypothetical protein
MLFEVELCITGTVGNINVLKHILARTSSKKVAIMSSKKVKCLRRPHPSLYDHIHGYNLNRKYSLANGGRYSQSQYVKYKIDHQHPHSNAC